jgi:hypothetical protein
LRPGSNADALRLGDRQEQPDAVPHPKAFALWIGQPIRYRDHQRDAVSIAIGHCESLSDTEREPEGLELALA